MQPLVSLEKPLELVKLLGKVTVRLLVRLLARLWSIYWLRERARCRAGKESLEKALELDPNHMETLQALAGLFYHCSTG